MSTGEMNAVQVYENLREDLLRYARSISKHGYEADDLVQDAMIKALDEPALAGLPVHKQKAWFFRVIKNRLIDTRRRDNRIVSWEDALELPVLPVGSARMEMTEWLGHLSPSQSDIVFKRYWLGMSSNEIGEQLGMPAATVRYKLQSAMRKLRKIWEDDMK